MKLAKLPVADQKHLEYAQGWLGLGNWLEANDEFNNITPGLRTHPEVLRVWFDIAQRGGNWKLAYGVAHALFEARGGRPVDLFNLARVACRLGKLTEAFEAIQQAIDCAGDFRKMALDDVDFKPLWAHL